MDRRDDIISRLKEELYDRQDELEVSLENVVKLDNEISLLKDSINEMEIFNIKEGK